MVDAVLVEVEDALAADLAVELDGKPTLESTESTSSRPHAPREPWLRGIEEPLRLGEQAGLAVDKRIAIAVLAAALAVGAPGCGDGDGGESAATPESGLPPAAGGPPMAPADAGEAMGRNAKPERAQPTPTGTAIKLDDSQFGPVLFDEAGQAIYLFDKETTAEARCYGQCAVEWPPVLTDGEPEAQSGISQGKLGSVSRRDGTRQATYNGHPLYYYAHEPPNEVRCHNIPGFGGLWLALNAEGDPA